MARQIPLTRGLVAIVDDADFDWLSQWKWMANGDLSRGCYASRVRRASERGFDKSHVFMHRAILAPPDGVQVDHINRDRLDNRRENLRLAVDGLNSHNRLMPNKTGFRGVFHYPTYTRPWVARGNVDGKQTHLGCFDTAADAARAYDRQARIRFGAAAVVNFPDEAT